MKQCKNNIEQNKVKQIEVNDKLSLLTIDQLTAEVMKYDNLDIKFNDIKEIDLSGIQFILALRNSSKNINIDLDINENAKALIVNTGFNKIL